MHLFFQIQNLHLLIFCMGDQDFLRIWIMFFWTFLCDIIEVVIETILYCFIKLLRLISSFLRARSLPVSCANVSIELIDCILLSSFELKAILLISLLKTLCLLLLNLCCVFNISLIFFMNSIGISTSILFFSEWLILFSIWSASKQF